MPPTRWMKVLGAAIVLGVVVFAAMSLRHQTERHDVVIQLGTASGSHVELSLNACNLHDYEHEVRESAESVTISVTAKGRSNEDCADGLSLDLPEPLGDRELIDGATGEPIPAPAP